LEGGRLLQEIGSFIGEQRIGLLHLRAGGALADFDLRVDRGGRGAGSGGRLVKRRCRAGRREDGVGVLAPGSEVALGVHPVAADRGLTG
jgi:predicted NAD/FAD-dependent oxidoreductase